MGDSFKVGEAPWEKQEAQDSFPVGQAPWDAPSDVENVAHPDISAMSRAVFKNLGTGGESGINYLQKENPGLEFKYDDSGEVLAKKRDEKSWKRLDPSGVDLTSMAGAKEALQDIGDVAFDIPAGLVQGAATAAAGIGAGAASGGLAALPAAMGAGAASGGALEAARQGLGKYFGVNEEMDPTSLKFAAGAGAVSPLLFGAGGTAAQVAKTAAKKGLASEGADALLKSQRGVLGRGYDAAVDYAGPKLGSLASGVKEEVIKTAKKILPIIKQADVDEAPIIKNLAEAQEKISKGLVNKSTTAGKGMEEIVSQIDEAGVTIKTGEIFQPVRDLIKKVEGESLDTNAKKELISELEGLMNKHFSLETQGMALDPATLQLKNVTKNEIPKEIGAKNANAFYFELKNLADQYGFDYGKIGTTGGALKGASRADARVAKAFSDAARNAKTSIKNAAGEADGELGAQYGKLNEQYSKYMDFRKDFDTASKSEDAFNKFLGRVSRDPVYRSLARDISKETGVDLKDTMLRNEAFKLFSKPSKDMLSLGGTTSTSRTIPLALGAGTLGYMAGQESGGSVSPFLSATIAGALGSRAGSPAALRRYMQMNQSFRQLPAKTGIQQITPVWMNLMNDKQGK